MWLVRFALTRPVTLMIAVSATILFSILAMLQMKVDIFPTLDVPRITVIQPYGGMDPAQMEAYLVCFYEQHFFYISGVDHVRSKSIQNAAVMDIYFKHDVHMSEAMSAVVAQVERSRAYMPPGTVTPFILRYDVGNVPVGFLVFSSDTLNLKDIEDLAYVRVRPVLSTIPGVSTPPPFGANERSIVVSVDKSKLTQYHLSVDDVVSAIANNNLIMPSGIVRTGGLQRISRINSVVKNIQSLGNVPVIASPQSQVYLHDLATVSDSTDIPTGYALVNGKRAIYMAVSKHADASTVSVVNGVKDNMNYMRSLLPKSVQLEYAFDQSVYVTEAVHGLLLEGLLGALLTGAVVLLFLKDIRSSIIVVLNIPCALLAAVVGLWASGQTINIMTLGGLALSVGILVDEATVVIENIHSHLASGASLHQAVFDASAEVLVPGFLAMLSVISVFLPSFFMVGATRSLFVPLSLAVGFAMLLSFILSETFVPVLSSWFLKTHPKQATSKHDLNTKSAKGFMERIRSRYRRLLIGLYKRRLIVLPVYTVLCLGSILIYMVLGSEIFPTGNPTSFQLRIKAPTGTRFERTEEITKSILNLIAKDAGANNIETTIAYAGTQPPSFAISNVYMWTSGPQEAVLMVALKDNSGISMSRLQEHLRRDLEKQYPDVEISFEAGDIVNKIMDFGSETPIRVEVDGPDYETDVAYAEKVCSSMQKIEELRDVQIIQPLAYPTVQVNVDRARAGELGVNMKDVSRALVAGTYSSRFVTPVYWRDPKKGIAYQVQVEVPAAEMNTLQDVGNLPAKEGSYSGPFVRDVGQIAFGTMPGELDHYNMRRLVSVSANIKNDDLGRATRDVQSALSALGAPPRGVRVQIHGQVLVMEKTFFALGLGVAFAVVAIFLLLAAFFQSLGLSMLILSVVPAIIFGAVTALLLTFTTVNVQSFMGTIMAIGVGVANSILVVVFAEQARLTGVSSRTAAIRGAVARLRPVLMTSLAMIAGMIPMALGFGEGGGRTAPLGRAVIGGLLASTTTVLLVLPLIYAMWLRKSGRQSKSLMPEQNQLHQFDSSNHDVSPPN